MNTRGTLPYPNNYFDTFIASEVLEHLDNQSLKNVIKEIYRILKPNGLAYLTFPAEENLKENECFCPKCQHIFHRYGHFQVWSLKLVKNRFSRFQIILIKDFFSIFIGLSPLKKILTIFATTLLDLVNKFEKLPGRSYLVILKKSRPSSG